jgi:DNA-binding NarL/FixJ family response regulator
MGLPCPECNADDPPRAPAGWEPFRQPKRPRVLLADDYPGMTVALKRLLTLDCDVVGSVEDGRAVLEAAQALHPDVIVLDLNMPHVNGIEACREIARALPRVKIIILSAASDAVLVEGALEAGASAFISKDAIGELLSTIKQACADPDA